MSRLAVLLCLAGLAGCATASDWVARQAELDLDLVSAAPAGAAPARPAAIATVSSSPARVAQGPPPGVAAPAAEPSAGPPAPGPADLGGETTVGRGEAAAPGGSGSAVSAPAADPAGLAAAAPGAEEAARGAASPPTSRPPTPAEPAPGPPGQAPMGPDRPAPAPEPDARPAQPSAEGSLGAPPGGSGQPPAAGSAGGGRAQERPAAPPPARVSLVSDALPLRRVLDSLAAAAGLVLDLPDRTRDLEPVSVELADVPADVAAGLIAAQFGWEAEVEAGRLRVITERLERVDLAFPDVRRSLTSKIGGDMTGSLFQGLQGQGASGAASATGAAGTGTASEKSLSSEVRVSYEVSDRDLWTELKQAAEGLLGPRGTVTVQREAGVIWLRGLPRAVRQAAEELKRLDRELSTPVYLQLTVLDVTLDRRHRFGIDWQKVFAVGHDFARLTVASPARAIAKGLAADGAFAIALEGVNGLDRAIIRALDEQGQARVLSQPRLSVANGQTAILTVGDIVPFVAGVQQSVAGASGTVLTTPIISQAQSGVTIAITPRVREGDVMLHLSPVVNDITAFKTFTVGGSTFENPVIATKSLSTVTRVGSGQTVLLGGLIDRRSKASEDEVPWLGRIPVLGRLFRNTERSRTARELVVIITPVIGHGPAVPPAGVGS